MAKDNKEIVIWGSLQMYYPILFPTSKNKKVQKKFSNYPDENIVIGVYDKINKDFILKDKVIDFFNSNTINATEELNKNLIESLLKDNIGKPININFLEGSTSSYDKDDLNIHIELSKNKTEGKYSSIFLNNLADFSSYNNDKILIDAEVYGYKLIYKDINRFILFPIKAYLNEEFFFLNVSLEVFTNGMGFIKIDNPIIERNSSDFYSSSCNKDFSKIELPLFMVKSDSNDFGYVEVDDTNIDDVIRNYYLKCIYDYFDKKVVFEKGMEHIIITQTNININTLNSMSKELEETLYRILHRPVDPHMSVKDKLTKIKNIFWGNHQVRTYAAESGHTLSIANNDMQKIWSEEWGKEIALDKIKFSLEQTIDMPLKIVILQKLNNIQLYQLSSRSELKKIEFIKQNYLENQIYISDLFHDFYGSAVDLIEFLKKGMRWYLNQEELSQKNTSLQNIVADIKERQNKRKNEYLAIVGFIFTIIFALPTLNETFNIFFNFLNIFPNIDERELVIEQLSITWATWSWFVIILFQLIMSLYFNSFNYRKLFLHIRLKISIFFKNKLISVKNICRQVKRSRREK